METTLAQAIKSQEVIDLMSNEELKKVLLDVLSQYEGQVVLSYDGREDGCISNIEVYAECFTKEHLDVLFQYCNYREIVFSKKYQALRLRLEMPL